VNVGPFTQFITPSITPFSFKNPAFRLFVTNEMYEPIRVDTYYLDLGKANANGRADWKLEYSLPQAYNMPDLSPNSFNNVARFATLCLLFVYLFKVFIRSQLLTNNTVWELWNVYHSCSTDSKASCDLQSCKETVYCTLMSPTSVEWNNCMIAHSA
jgi:hypothetical protein